MSNINWGRFVVGGIVASIIAFITDGLLHESIVGSDWKAVYDNLGASHPEHNSIHMIYFAVFELGRGFISMFLYVLMRPHCKPGPKTAALAGGLPGLLSHSPALRSSFRWDSIRMRCGLK